MARADQVIAGSAYAAALVARELGVPAAQDHRARRSARRRGPPRCARRGGRGSGGPFLFIGTLEPRKNVGVLLDAYARLRSRRAERRRSCWPAAITEAAHDWVARARRRRWRAT